MIPPDGVSPVLQRGKGRESAAAPGGWVGAFLLAAGGGAAAKQYGTQGEHCGSACGSACGGCGQACLVLLA